MRRARVVLCLPDRAVRAQVARRVEEAAPAQLFEVPTGPDAFEAALRELPDLVILAADLPGQDGLTVCHRLRGVPALVDVPVMIFGPKGDQRRKYQAFYVGATEYVEVPFDGVELGFRIKIQLRALLRAGGGEAREELVAGPLKLVAATREADLAGQRAVLTPSEFAVLRQLATQAGTPVGVERLLAEALRRPAGLGNPQLIHTHIRNLRKKLEADPSNPRWLLRHPAGYLLAVEG